MTRITRAVVAVTATAVLTLLAGPAVAGVGSGDEFPPATGCLSGPRAPGLFVQAGGIDGYAVAVGAQACRYLAVAPGGFSSLGDFTLRIEREGRVRVIDQTRHRCADDVVRVGDRVTLVATVAAEVGAGSGCERI